jgi:hypothetical protein
MSNYYLHFYRTIETIRPILKNMLDIKNVILYIWQREVGEIGNYISYVVLTSREVV